MKRDIMAADDKSTGYGSMRASGLSDDIQAKIGSQLKSIYDNVLDEPVPDRIAGLLRQLERASEAESKRGQD